MTPKVHLSYCILLETVFIANFKYIKHENDSVTKASNLLERVILENKFEFANLLMDHGIGLNEIIDKVKNIFNIS